MPFIFPQNCVLFKPTFAGRFAAFALVRENDLPPNALTGAANGTARTTSNIFGVHYALLSKVCWF